MDNSTCNCHHPPTDKKALTVLTVGWNCGRPVPCVKIAHPPHSPFSSKGEWGGFLYTLSFFVQFKPPLQTTLFQAVGGWEKNLAGVRILKPIDIRLEPKWPEGLFQPPPKTSLGLSHRKTFLCHCFSFTTTRHVIATTHPQTKRRSLF